MAGTPAPQIISHYQVESLLGVGAMGSVYLGIDRRDGTLVAIKRIAPFLAQDQEFRGRFEREAHVAALLRSPYTVRVLEYGVEEGRVYMAIEYVDGPAVRELLESGPLEPGRAARIALQVARALEEAEARGIVHRDIKPDNILLGPEDTAKLADFGVARQEASRLTQTGGFYGTAAYAAPEQFGGHADNRSDIYALGATLYHMLLGRPVVSGDLERARRRVIAGDIAFSDLAELLELREVVEKAMATDPEERYQSARQFAGALEGALVSLGGTSASALATVVGSTATEGYWRSEEESLRLALKGPTTSLPFGKRYASLKYELEVTNQGQEEAKVRLRAADRANACRFSMPEAVSVPAGATSHVAFKVKPQKRRIRGPDLTRIFTVAASRGGGGGSGGGGGAGDSGGGGDADAGGGGPPSTASGRFEDSSYGWLPLGMSGVALVVAVVALLVATVGTGASGDEEPQALKIGLLFPLSGPFFGEGVVPQEKYGQAYLNAARMAVAEINESGGVLGQPVTLAQGDSAEDAEIAVQEARRLIDEEGVQVIVSETDKNRSLEVANRVTNPSGVVHIVTSYLQAEELDFLSQPIESDHPFLFKTQVGPAAEGVALAQLAKDSGLSPICLIHDLHAEEFLVDEFVEATPGLEVALVQYAPEFLAEFQAEPTPSSDETWRQHAVAMMEECGKPRVVVLALNTFTEEVEGPLTGEGEEVEVQTIDITSYILREVLSSGAEAVYVSSGLGGVVVSEHAELRDAAADEVPPGSPFPGLTWEEAAIIRGTYAFGDGIELSGARFDRAYEGRFGKFPADLQYRGNPLAPTIRSVYDAVYLAALAAERAGSTDPDEIRKALPEVTNEPGSVVGPGPTGGGPDSVGGFAFARDAIARGEDLDYEGAVGPIEFNEDRDNVRGAVLVWRVDQGMRTFVSENAMVVDMEKVEAQAADRDALAEYFAAFEAVGLRSDEKLDALYAQYPGAFSDSVEDSKALYPGYVEMYEEFLVGMRGLSPPEQVAELHRQLIGSNERVQAFNRERLEQLGDVTTQEEIDAIFGTNAEWTDAVTDGRELCFDGRAMAAAYGIDYSRPCGE